MTPPPGAPAPVRRLKWATWGWVGGFVAASVVASIVAGPDGVAETSISLALVLQLPLWLGFVAPVVVGRRWGLDWRRDLGWHMRGADPLMGLALGSIMQLALPLLYLPIFEVIGDRDVGAEAREFIDRAVGVRDVAALVVITVVAAPVVEELFYRGLVHRALARRFSRSWAVPVSSVLFAASHLQPLQFPALVVFGAVLAVVVDRTDRLGLAVWMHVGFNATTVALLLPG